MPQSPKHGPERHWFRVAVFSQSRNKFAKEDGAHMNYQNGLQLDTNQPFFLPISKKFLHAGEIQASKKSLEVCVTKTLLNTTTVLIPHCQVVLHWRMGHTLVRSCKASFALIFAAGRVSLIFNDAPPAVKKAKKTMSCSSFTFTFTSAPPFGFSRESYRFGRAISFGKSLLHYAQGLTPRDTTCPSWWSCLIGNSTFGSFGVRLDYRKFLLWLLQPAKRWFGGKTTSLKKVMTVQFN